MGVTMPNPREEPPAWSELDVAALSFRPMSCRAAIVRLLFLELYNSLIQSLLYVLYFAEMRRSIVTVIGSWHCPDRG